MENETNKKSNIFYIKFPFPPFIFPIVSFLNIFSHFYDVRKNKCKHFPSTFFLLKRWNIFFWADHKKSDSEENRLMKKRRKRGEKRNKANPIRYRLWEALNKNYSLFLVTWQQISIRIFISSFSLKLLKAIEWFLKQKKFLFILLF